VNDEDDDLDIAPESLTDEEEKFWGHVVVWSLVIVYLLYLSGAVWATSVGVEIGNVWLIYFGWLWPLLTVLAMVGWAFVRKGADRGGDSS
jgi:hypothetical protein